MNKQILVLVFCLILLLSWNAFGQNAVIVVIDGARYSETLGAKDRYIPKIWNELHPRGTIWTDFFNNGITSTVPGHSSIITGTWQKIDNKGLERPNKPTLFEYFRKETGPKENSTAVIAGKSKLNVLTYSTSKGYGPAYKSSFFVGKNDSSVVNILKIILARAHPRIILVHLPDVDSCGHSGLWEKYISAIHTADSLVYEIWRILQIDRFYKNKTTLFVTNDHGRHDDFHGGFKKHGDTCEGCRHIMLLAVGRGFSRNKLITKNNTQCDIAPTIGDLLSFSTKYADGKSLIENKMSVKH